jgi:hypothetical protein
MSLGHCIVAIIGEAECNSYLLDINIYSLSKKEESHSFVGLVVRVSVRDGWPGQGTATCC